MGADVRQVAQERKSRRVELGQVRSELAGGVCPECLNGTLGLLAQLFTCSEAYEIADASYM